MFGNKDRENSDENYRSLKASIQKVKRQVEQESFETKMQALDIKTDILKEIWDIQLLAAKTYDKLNELETECKQSEPSTEPKPVSKFIKCTYEPCRYFEGSPVTVLVSIEDVVEVIWNPSSSKTRVLTKRSVKEGFYYLTDLSVEDIYKLFKVH